MKMCIKFKPNKSSQLALKHVTMYLITVRPVQFIPVSLFNWPVPLQLCYTVDIAMLLYCFCIFFTENGHC